MVVLGRPDVPIVALGLFLIFVASVLAGCVGGDDAGDDGNAVFSPSKAGVRLARGDLAAKQAALAEIHAQPHALEANVTIHVVFAGLPEEKLDEQVIRGELVSETEPIIAARSFRFANEYHLPLAYRFNYEFHRAPEAFVEGFFEEAAARTQWAAPTAFLCAYDRDLGHYRLSGPNDPVACRKGEASYDDGTIVGDLPQKVRLIDATAMEAWIARHRGEHGLEFAQPSYTLFFLDGWTPGLLADEAYHYYHFLEDHAYEAGGQMTNLRAWGGNHDFLFLDHSAAPNNDLYDNTHQSWVITRLGFVWGYGTADTDPPIWDFGEGANSRVWRENADNTVADVDLNERIGRNVDAAVQLRLMPTGYAYRPEYKPTYFINFHHYQEQESIQPPDQMADRVDMPGIIERLATQIPWADFDHVYKSYLLPDDDPGMQEAVREAKRHGVGTYVHPQPIKDYVDANIERFTQPGDDIFNVKVMAFNFAGPYTIAYPAVVSGIGTSDSEGRPWGIIENVNDVELYAYDPGNGHEYNGLTAHEVGHFFGFHHPHDGVMRNREGQYEDAVEWTWDQTATVMSYRVEPFGGDQLDRDHIARGQASLLVNEALVNVRTAYEALLARGQATMPAAAQPAFQGVEDSVNSVFGSFEAGRWIDAVVAAVAALEQSHAAIDAAGGVTLTEVVLDRWSVEGLNHASAEQGTLPATFVSIPGAGTGVGTPLSGLYAADVLYDYRQIQLDPSYGSVIVEVTWENSPASFSDLFAGWAVRDPATLSDAPGNAERHKRQGPTYDFVKEGPLDVGNRQTATLDLRYTDMWNWDELWVGAGTTQAAANGAYAVTVKALQRTYT